MSDILQILLPLFLGAVVIVLFLGLRNLLHGGSASTSQTLMRWRVGLQFIAIVLVMAALYFANS